MEKAIDIAKIIAAAGKLKLPLRKKALECFIYQTLFVCMGLRESYLIDCFCLSVKDVSKILCLFSRHVQESVCVITLPTNDMFVVNREKIIAKCALEMNELQIINICGDVPYLIAHDTHRSDIITALQRTCNTICKQCTNPNIPIIDAEIDISLVGYDMFAGWMLGYPYIYHYVPTTSGTNALSMEPLTQISFTATSHLGNEYDLCTFTVPSNVISRETINTYVQSKMHAYQSVERKNCELLRGIEVEILDDIMHASISL